MRAQYRTTVTSSGGRDGHIRRSADGVLDLPLLMPKELGGSGKPGMTNSEQLFATGYAACFENALMRAARELKAKLARSAVTPTVGIGRREDGRFGLEVALAASSGLRAEAQPEPRTRRSVLTRERSGATLRWRFGSSSGAGRATGRRARRIEIR